MHDLVGRFRKRASDRIANSVANALVARTWEQAADEVQQYLAGGRLPPTADVLGIPSLAAIAKAVDQLGGKAEPPQSKSRPKKTTRAEQRAMQDQPLLDPARVIIRNADGWIEGADIVAAMKAQGIDVNLTRLLSVLHAMWQAGDIEHEKTRYRAKKSAVFE